MAQQPELPDQHDPDAHDTDAHDPAGAASPVPNRRDRRGKKSAVAAQPGGKLATPRQPAPIVLPRQYSTRRRSG